MLKRRNAASIIKYSKLSDSNKMSFAIRNRRAIPFSFKPYLINDTYTAAETIIDYNLFNRFQNHIHK